jgi:hypothetical protein
VPRRFHHSIVISFTHLDRLWHILHYFQHVSFSFLLYGFCAPFRLQRSVRNPLKMASITRRANSRIIAKDIGRIPASLAQIQRTARLQKVRGFSTSPRCCEKHTEYKESFGTRLRRALGGTKIKWYPIPVGVGIGFLGLAQLYRINDRENAKRREEDLENDGYVYSKGEGENTGRDGRPRRRERIRPTGPWYVISLPLTYCLALS